MYFVKDSRRLKFFYFNNSPQKIWEVWLVYLVIMPLSFIHCFRKSFETGSSFDASYATMFPRNNILVFSMKTFLYVFELVCWVSQRLSADLGFIWNLGTALKVTPTTKLFFAIIFCPWCVIKEFFIWRKNKASFLRDLDFRVSVRSTEFKICDVIISIAT